MTLLLVACADPETASAEQRAGWEQQLAGWTASEPIPAFSLVDEAERTFSLDRYRDSWLLVGFVFTRCGMPEACPRTMEKMREVQELGGGRPRLLALTLDPAWDTPERLSAYGTRYGADPSIWTLATGPDRLMTDGLPSLFAVLSLPEGPDSLRHTVKVALLRPGLRIEREWKDNAWDPAEVVRIAGGP